MTIKDTTSPSQTTAIAFEFELHHAQDKVWRALTDPVLLQEWLLPVVDGKLALGERFTFQTQAMPGWDGKVNCRMLEIEPKTRLSYAWIVGDMNTVVTFTLTPTSSGTHVSLVQSGFTETQKQNFAGARYGWKMMGAKLLDVLARST